MILYTIEMTWWDGTHHCPWIRYKIGRAKKPIIISQYLWKFGQSLNY